MVKLRTHVRESNALVSVGARLVLSKTLANEYRMRRYCYSMTLDFRWFRARPLRKNFQTPQRADAKLYR